MKKQPSIFHKLWGLVEKELEASLAVLVVLGAIFGYSLAGTELVTGDIQIAQTTQSFMIGGRSYSALNFSTKNVAGAYRVRLTPANVSPSDVAQTTAGARGQATGANYVFTLSLDEPFTGSAFAWGEFSRVQINNTLVASPLGAAHLANDNQLVITFVGGETLSRIALVPGTVSDAPAVKPVASLNILPGSATVTVGGEYTFIALPRDNTGITVSNALINWSVDNTSLATINSVTGQLKALKTGQLVVKAVTDGAVASATVTIIPAVVTAPIKTITEKPDTTTSIYPGAPESTIYPGAPENGSVLDKVAGALTAPATGGSTVETKTAVGTALDAFAAEQAKIAQTKNSIYVSQTVLNQILAENTTTATQRFGVKIALGVQQIISDLKEMFSPASDQNVFKKVGLLIVDLFTNPGDSGAAPTGFGGSEVEPQ
ncbi:MAG: hypothetical protein VE98_C0001G0098 [candidate division Kazan bacterium GW2011_GWA1_50_15]|uniref:BIG2 domain-containing protein n=2 Tax=Bacteria division Kazan-3B-28 TaxID=1798534 RepID=A0A0G1X7X2_UNCK3|nr:MAG: hypothetical protein VE98_C0001G0098 [candidate division Kazan bacterium GW2011_GWA1_50_15]KKW25625.1 MAG: hypothetical protein VE99_C0001G0262 [candidate division Kazan bacterium GW2011_GWC1_52_13]KKW26930.1 MAG: hypothetical protein VF00_C0002G0255 [candidate division Kazan bacterium GW2011_GWB1_52_7]HAV66081.1 hypothetical protein [Patescibacteria group bacterium]